MYGLASIAKAEDDAARASGSISRDQSECINNTLLVTGIVADMDSRGPTKYLLTVENERNQTWVISRRYSEFAIFRSSLMGIFSIPHNCEGNCLITQAAVTFNFPRKHIFSSKTPRVIEQRTSELMAFLCQLLDCTNGMLFRNCTFALEHGVLSKIEDFLIPNEMREVDTANPAIALMETLQSVSVEDVERIKAEDKDICYICLDEGDITQVVQLACSHTFHRECLSDWLSKTLDCPCCRESVIATPKTM